MTRASSESDSLLEASGVPPACRYSRRMDDPEFNPISKYPPTSWLIEEDGELWLTDGKGGRMTVGWPEPKTIDPGSPLPDDHEPQSLKT